MFPLRFEPMPTPLSPLPEPLPSAARERVVEVLKRQFANDELTLADLERRLQHVYEATTPQELAGITGDLPAVPAHQGADAKITALFSGQERKLTGVVPRELSLRARVGYVELDLTGATFEPGVTTIDVRTFMGYVEMHLPAGVRVETEGRALFGYFSTKGSGPEGKTTSVVRITGRAALGYAEIWIA